MKSIFKASGFVPTFIGAVFLTHPANAQTCEEGIWDLETSGKSPDGQTYESAATSTRYCLFGGKANLDEYRALTPDGKIVFMGASFDFPSEDGQRIQTLWVMVGDPGYTLIDGRIINGRLVSNGTGNDSGGEFLERSETSYSGERDYTFDMARSYDGGKTWIESFSHAKATFRSNEVPALPEEYHFFLGPIQEAVEHPEGSQLILNGLGEIEELDQTPDGQNGLTLKFSSRYLSPDRWRSIYWMLGSDDISFEEISLENSDSAGS